MTEGLKTAADVTREMSWASLNAPPDQRDDARRVSALDMARQAHRREPDVRPLSALAWPAHIAPGPGELGPMDRETRLPLTFGTWRARVWWVESQNIGRLIGLLVAAHTLRQRETDGIADDRDRKALDALAAFLLEEWSVDHVPADPREVIPTARREARLVKVLPEAWREM